jgi:toxin-antitoxin system PIN domain toxin
MNLFLPDVNIFVDAFRQPGASRDWLENARASRQRIGVLLAVAASTVRILTHPKIWERPALTTDVVKLFDELLETPNTNLVDSVPSARAWKLFSELVDEHGVAGNDIPDALLAATAQELNATLVSRDKGFTRFHNVKLLTVTG